ncbi:hypothetical protein Tco_1137821, partial [Tanacetum coccineum]
NDGTLPWGNIKRKEKEEDDTEWVIRSKFKDELANFMLEKKSHTKGIREMLDQHCKEMHEQFSQILYAIRERKTPKPEATTFSPFPSRVKKQKKDDEDEWLFLIFKRIHINLPFLEAMIHMPKGANVLKDLLSHKKKLYPKEFAPKKKETQEASYCHVLLDPWQSRMP